MARIENHKYTVEEAFRECFYVVPDYQREYVWGEREVRQLLDDINEQVGAGSQSEYFIGTVLVSPGSRRGEFDVIDGQQRLTTLFLLLSALKQKFRGEPQHQTINALLSTSYTDAQGDTRTSLKLDPRYENASEVVQAIIAADATAEDTRNHLDAKGIQRFGSLENLLAAYGTIHTYLDENYQDAASRKRYWGYLATNVVFIQISTEVSSALKIFETINERGVGLNPMDLLKNLLFTRVQKDEFSKLKDEWKKITKPLEKAGEKPLRFLRYFLMANYVIDNARKDHIVREDEIYDWLTKEANAKLCGYRDEPFVFIRKLIRGVDLFIGFSQSLGNDGKPNDRMATMQRLCGSAFSMHFILLMAAAPLPKPLFDHFVAQLESFLFTYIFTRTATKDLERSFSVWADEMRDIASARPSEQTQKLNDFIAARFQSGITDREVELSDALRRYSLASMQKYRTRYLLAKLTQFVEMAYQGLTSPGSLEPFMTLEIEHILPDTPTPELTTSFTQANPDAPYDEYKTRLGNLTLLEKPINVVASNGFFEAKKPEYRNCGNYLTRSLVELANVGKNSSITRINKRLRSFDSWGAKSIDERQAMLIELSREIWKASPLV